jgi:hypothetical protein
VLVSRQLCPINPFLPVASFHRNFVTSTSSNHRLASCQLGHVNLFHQRLLLCQLYHINLFLPRVSFHVNFATSTLLTGDDLTYQRCHINIFHVNFVALTSPYQRNAFMSTLLHQPLTTRSKLSCKSCHIKLFLPRISFHVSVDTSTYSSKRLVLL